MKPRHDLSGVIQTGSYLGEEDDSPFTLNRQATAAVPRAASFMILSRERDMDAFAAGKRHRRRTPSIEIYPKGYLPPSILSLRRAKTVRASDTIAQQTE